VSVALDALVARMDSYLRIRELPDESNAVNGLQVENRGVVSRLVAAVDACQATIDHVAATAERDGPALLLVHHGLFWDGNVPITGRRGRRVRALFEADTALYGAHIPLDLHPEVGNNAVLAAKLGIAVEGTFGGYRGVQIGTWGRLSADRDALRVRLEQVLDTAQVKLIAGGPQQTSRVGIITGGASSAIADARDLGLDTFITGEGPHHTYFDAIEWGLNVYYAGHYATETVGVQALAAKLSSEFELPWSFHHHPTGL